MEAVHFVHFLYALRRKDVLSNHSSFNDKLFSAIIIFFFSFFGEAVNKYVRRTQLPLIINNSQLIINNLSVGYPEFFSFFHYIYFTQFQFYYLVSHIKIVVIVSDGKDNFAGFFHFC